MEKDCTGFTFNLSQHIIDTAMIKGENFIFTGLQPWDISIGSNAKDIALEVSKHNKVLYVNTPLDIKTYLSKEYIPETVQRRKVINKQEHYLRQVNSNLWVLDYPFTIWPNHFLPDGFLFDIVNKANNHKMYTFCNKVLKSLGFNEYILFIDNDIYRSLHAPEMLKPSFSIYYRRDNLISDFWKKHAQRLEPLICKKCTCVLANSEQLANAVKTYNNNTHNIGQGVDLSNYDESIDYQKPSDLENIPNPIIGYTGMLTSKRLDINLIYQLASKLKDVSFVFVGAEDDVFKKSKVHTLSNVYFLGAKSPELIPNYICYFDICINPQLINPITIGNYPRKIDEYLALGKPVIATKTETMSIFSGYSWNCTGADEYIDAINNILANKNVCNKETSISFAKSHSWENSVASMYNYISGLFNKK